MTSEKRAPNRFVADSSPADDLVLLRQVAAKDRKAFERLFVAYYPRVVRFLYRLTRNTELADEVFNDVMLVVWQKAKTFQGRSKVSTWILGIAYRKGLKAIHRAHRIASRESLSELELASLKEPGSIGERRELRDWVGKALMELSPPQRTVIELAYYLGYSCSEISQIVGCPVNTVKTRMFHARKRLEKILPHLGAVSRPRPSTETPL